MRSVIPSFRAQIIFLVLLLVMASALFFRHFFLESFQEYAGNVESLDVSGKMNQLYRDHSSRMDAENQDKFREDVESILSTEWQRSMEADVFRKEIRVYSQFIFLFLVMAVLILFFITFNLISRPLRRLQSGTEALTKGKWETRVKESTFSPLNALITSFNKMARELESNREKLIQAEKESMWRHMARVMAHEIKNPLTPIRLALDRLEQKRESGGQASEKVFQGAARVIHEEIDNLQSLATEFSEFARLPEADIVPHNLNEQLKEVILPYQDKAAFTLKLSDDLPTFHGDGVQMKQVFVNLIQNAIQSSGDDCIINISTSLTRGHIIISFSDNGSGIISEDQRRIFEPYFSKREKGTGLGLAIVKRIVEQHDGSIEVQSQVGVGTTFTLAFPNRDSDGGGAA